jgi:outer membrane protein OmpA-like peptidoglycan-associated protein
LKLAAAKKEALKREADRKLAQKKALEAKNAADKQEAAKREAERKEAERQELLANQELARLEAAQKELERKAAAREAAEKKEAERKEMLAKKEAERLEAAQKEAERKAAAKAEAERIAAEKKELLASNEAEQKQPSEPKEAVEPVKLKEEKAETDDTADAELSLVIVENIYYAYGDYKIGPDGESVLNKAAEALIEYPKLVMEIHSHTDAQSSSGFNIALSHRRAQAAVDYLVGKGISKKRLKAKGFGETKLLNHCADGVTCTDEEHRVNRRTEFKIIKPIR